MARKITALEKASREAAGDGVERFKQLAYSVIFGLCLVGMSYSGWQLVANTWYQAGQASVESAAQSVAAEVGQRLTNYRDQVASLGGASEVNVASMTPDDETFSRAESGLRQRVTEAVRVRLLLPEIEQLDPQPFPGLGYSALSLLLQAKTVNRLVGPGVGLARTQNSHLSWAMPVGDGVGLLLVSYPMAIVSDVLDEASVGSGYLDFRSQLSGNSALIAISRGALGGANPDNLPSVEIEGSRFSVAFYRSEPPLYTGASTISMAVILVLCAFLLAVATIWRFRPEMLDQLMAAKEPEEVEEESEATLAEIAEADEDLKEAMEFAKDIKDRGPAAVATATEADLPQTIFRAYDIRGIVGETLTVPVAASIGRAVGSEARDRGVSQIVVARDGRLSGADMAGGLIEGIQQAGVDVIDIGAVPTGVLYFATHHLGTGSGVMVTGSHNPPNYNGFKILLAGRTLSGDAIQGLYQRIVEQRFSEGSGGVQEMDVLQEYVDRIAGDVQVEEPLKVVIDCGNGIPGRIAPLVMEEIGCEVVPLYCEVDGNFPNHHPDPSDPDNLQDLIMSVRNLDADLGVALDGDGDRLGVVTKEGEIVYPDRLLMLFAQDVLTRNPGAAVIYDVKCTSQLARVVLNHGGSPIMWKTGHSLIKSKMRETSAALAGEMSGHFFFQERWYGFDDGIYACARLLEILAAEGVPPSETLEALPNSVSTPELKIEMEEGEHFAFLEAFQAGAKFDGARITDIDGIRADYDDGWGLVRCSNTTPCLVLRFDAATQEALQRIQEVFREQILAVSPELELPF